MSSSRLPFIILGVWFGLGAALSLGQEPAASKSTIHLIGRPTQSTETSEEGRTQAADKSMYESMRDCVDAVLKFPSVRSLNPGNLRFGQMIVRQDPDSPDNAFFFDPFGDPKIYHVNLRKIKKSDMDENGEVLREMNIPGMNPKPVIAIRFGTALIPDGDERHETDANKQKFKEVDTFDLEFRNRPTDKEIRPLEDLTAQKKAGQDIIFYRFGNIVGRDLETSASDLNEKNETLGYQVFNACKWVQKIARKDDPNAVDDFGEFRNGFKIFSKALGSFTP